MKARKCDRCGGFYIIEVDEFGRVPTTGFHNIFYDGEQTDLCQGCREQFEAWMNMEEEK